VTAYDQIDEKTSLTAPSQRTVEAQTAKLKEVYEAISVGAEAFLRAEYSVCAIFVVLFAILIFCLIAWGQNASEGFLTTLSFVLGAVTSIVSGYIGMKVAVFSNVRTTINAQKDGYEHCFNTAFRAGAVMGFALTGLGILVLYGTLLVYAIGFTESSWEVMMGCISGYGLGGSSIAMFGRVGGGIYTKAADVGADLVGKVVHGIPEDDPRNPATIADNGKATNPPPHLPHLTPLAQSVTMSVMLLAWVLISLAPSRNQLALLL
jgi:H+-translocating diphosphatase